MKIHITNLYNFKRDDELVIKQHRLATAGYALGFLEMGIFAYPVETDTPGELSKRLDGVIASLEAEDVVILQLPTENGLLYESLLVRKIKAYAGTKLILALHDEAGYFQDRDIQDGYEELCRLASAVVKVQEMPEASMQKFLMDAVGRIYEEPMERYRLEFQREKDEIQVGFGLHDKTGDYSVWVGTVMQSIMEHTYSPICFHILHDEMLSEDNKRKLKQEALQGGHRVRFHFLSMNLFSEVAQQTGSFTIGTMFRIMLPELLPDLSKIIYLDADLLVNRDIKDLWEVDIREYCLAAVPDVGTAEGNIHPIPVIRKEVERGRYFNAGVLCLNLDRIREKGSMRTQILDYLVKTPEAAYPDQDALNVIYRYETLLLDDSWNYFSVIVRDNNEKELKKYIYHYASTRLLLYAQTGMERLYYETIKRTPWGAVECRKQLDKAFERMGDRASQLEKAIQQTTIPNKKRFFYGQETVAMKNLYELVGVREDDCRILANYVQEKTCLLPCKPFSMLKEEKEEFIVYVLPEADEWSAIARLERFGLENGKDFLVIPRILSWNKGGYL